MAVFIHRALPPSSACSAARATTSLVCSATVVRVQRGEVLMTDGPFAEGKEHIGGFLIVKVADLDAALEWARKAARALAIGEGESQNGLAIEVRPFQGEA